VQYTFSDTSKDGRAQWTGSLNRNPKLRMVGELQIDRNGNIYYDEWLYDNTQAGKVVFSSSSACRCLAPAPPFFDCVSAKALEQTADFECLPISVKLL
jgi:hypothetical protein